MQKRHTDRESYFDEQSQTSKNYYIPYIKEVIGHIPDKVLEVGCGEGGNLLPFAEAGCRTPTAAAASWATIAAWPCTASMH